MEIWFTRTPNDENPNEKMKICFGVPASFRFGDRIETNLEYGPSIKYALETCIEPSGLVVIELSFDDNVDALKSLGDAIRNKPIEVDKEKLEAALCKLSSGDSFETLSEDDEGEEEIIKTIRDTVREVYFQLKETYHNDIHHVTSKNQADDLLSLYFAKNETEGINKICSAFLRLCENNIEEFAKLRFDYDNRSGINKLRGRKGYDSHFNRLCKRIGGFIAYGSNFISIFKTTLSTDCDKYFGSLSSCSKSIESLDAYNSKEFEHSISWRMLLLTVAMAAFASVSIIALFK